MTLCLCVCVWSCMCVCHTNVTPPTAHTLNLAMVVYTKFKLLHLAVMALGVEGFLLRRSGLSVALCDLNSMLIHT